MWRKRRKALLVVTGILYLIFGILAFFDIPGGHDEHHHTYAHNLTHIVLGLILLAVTLKRPAPTRQGLCFTFATIYFLIAFSGSILGKSASLVVLPGIIEFHAGDYAVHFATALFFIALGMLKRSDQKPVA